MDKGASVPDQALAVPVEPVARLDPSGFDPSRLRKLKQHCAGLRNLAGSMRREGSWPSSAMFVTEAAAIIEDQAAEISALTHDLRRHMAIANHCLNDSDGMAVRSAALNALRACQVSEDVFAAVASATYAVIRAASGIETEGQDGATRLGAEHESPTAESGDAQVQPLEPKD